MIAQLAAVLNVFIIGSGFKHELSARKLKRKRAVMPSEGIPSIAHRIQQTQWRRYRNEKHFLPLNNI